MIFSTKPSRRETLWGGIYLILFVVVLPWLAPLILKLAGPGLDPAQVNFIYFMLNFAATTVIFREYLIQSVKDSLRVIFPTVWFALLGYLGSQMLGSLLVAGILRFYPEFISVNDGTILELVRQNPRLIFIGSPADAEAKNPGTGRVRAFHRKNPTPLTAVVYQTARGKRMALIQPDEKMLEALMAKMKEK